MNDSLTLSDLLINSSIDAIIAFDSDRRIIAWNRTAEEMYGRLSSQVIGASLESVIPGLHEDAESLHAIKLALEGFKSFVPADRSFPHRQQSENHYIPLVGNNKGCVMNIVHDVAHRIKAERELERLNAELNSRYRQLEKTSKELANFTVISSNNIKKPIRQIYTDVEYLIKVEARRLSDSGKGTFRRMQSSLNRMNLLLDDMLSISEISILARPEEEVDLHEIAAAAIAKVSEKAVEQNPIIQLGDLCRIKGHRGQLEMLVKELVENAIKFNTSPTPEVVIDCAEVSTNGKNFYRVRFKDNGIGIAEGDKDRIFNIFEKLNPPNAYRGSGIGLARVAKVMDAHDGFMRVESHLGAGSVFSCYFPDPS